MFSSRCETVLALRCFSYFEGLVSRVLGSPTSADAALPIDIQEVAVCTRAVESSSSLVFVTEMVTASVLQQAGVTNRLVL